MRTLSKEVLLLKRDEGLEAFADKPEEPEEERPWGQFGKDHVQYYDREGNKIFEPVTFK